MEVFFKFATNDIACVVQVLNDELYFEPKPLLQLEQRDSLPRPFRYFSGPSNFLKIESKEWN